MGGLGFCPAVDGLIDPVMFPARAADLDTEAIRGSAGVLRGLGSSIVSRTDLIASSWNGLAGCYQAPESERVFSLMVPVTVAAGEVDAVYAGMAARLDVYADELDVVKPKLADLERRAQAFRDKVKGGVRTSSLDEQGWLGNINPLRLAEMAGVDFTVTVDWSEHDPTVEKNLGYWGELGDLVEQITASAAACANAINRLVNPTQCAIPIEAITSEQAMASFVDTWGVPTEQDRNCTEQIGAGLQDFGTGIAEGVGGLVVGYDPASGDFFTGAGWGQSWSGLGNLAMSLLLVPTAGLVAFPMMATGNHNGFTDFMYDRGVVLRDTGASLVAFDPYATEEEGGGWHLWKDEGLRAGTSTVANIGTFFIPAAGGIGAGAKTAAGARAASLAGTVAEVASVGGSWAVKGALGATRGISALARGGGWGAAVEAARFSTSGARVGGITNAGIQSIHDLTNTSPPKIGNPSSLPNITNTIPVRPRNTGMGAKIPGVNLTDDAIREGISSWVNDKPRIDVVDQTPTRAPEPTQVTAPEHARVPERELATIGAHPGQVTNTVGTTHPHGAGTGGSPHTGNSGSSPSPHTGGGSSSNPHTGSGSGGTGRGGVDGPGNTGTGGPSRGGGNGPDGPGKSYGDGPESGRAPEHGKGPEARHEPESSHSPEARHAPETSYGSESGHSLESGNGPEGGKGPEGGHGPEAGIGSDGLVGNQVSAPGGGQGWPDAARDFVRPEVERVIEVTGKDVPGPKTAFTNSRFVKNGLEPDSLYHVPGRGDFYTNAVGEIIYVETTYGGKNGLNWDLMKPKPDTTYVVHPEVTYPSPGASYAHVFVTNSDGATVLAHTDRLARGEGIRSESVQSRVGRQGGVDYDGGHGFGPPFGGGGEEINLTSQLKWINQNYPNSFYRLEELWRDLIPDRPGPHPEIEVDIQPIYEPGVKRPLRYEVDYRIDGGEWEGKQFTNV